MKTPPPIPDANREPIYRQSEKIAPFCPDCGTELNRLDMINCYSACKCGEWWDATFGKTMFRAYPPKKPLQIIYKRSGATMTKDTPPLQLDAATEEELDAVLKSIVPDQIVSIGRPDGTVQHINQGEQKRVRAKAAIARLLIRERVEEIRQNYGSVLEVIQERKGDPDLMWHEILHPLVEREAQLQAQLEKEAQSEQKML